MSVRSEPNSLESSFNSLPVLIEPLVEASKEPHVIVAGAWKPSVPQSHSSHDDPLQRSDPWARWNKDQPAAATATRPTPAPMANALQQQDTKIDRMQAHLTALEGKLATHVEVTPVQPLPQPATLHCEAFSAP